MSLFSDLWDAFTSPSFNDPFSETLFYVLTQTTPLGDVYDAYQTVQDYESLVSAMVASGQNYNFSADWTDYAGNNASYGLTTNNDRGSGLDGNDSIFGYAGNDVLDGGTGVDYLRGGLGSDVYFVDQTDDNVGEVDQGSSWAFDVIFSSATFYNVAYVESLTLTGTANIDAYGMGSDEILTGNAGNNKLYGYGGDDILIGNAGNDTLYGGGNTPLGDSMYGGSGDDTFYVDSIYDVAIGDSGYDTVISTVTSYDGYYLRGTVEKLVLGNGALRGIGDGGHNLIVGNDLANTLEDPDSAVSSDTLIGGGGNDTLKGFGGNDYLDGGTGGDVMYGGLGDDTYVVDSTSDQVIESTANAQGGGTDTVLSKLWAIDLSGYANIDNITLVEGAYKAIGDSTANLIIGSTGNNWLDGSTGRDTLRGGAGNDTYVVDLTGGLLDIVEENASEGIDTIRTFTTFSLADLPNVENLTLTDDQVVADATGNDAANYIKGSQATNVLTGMGGNDTLESMTATNGFSIGGPDTLYGGTGNDYYIIANGQLLGANGSSIDTVVENASEGIDTIEYWQRNPFGGPPNYTLSDNIENFIARSVISSITGNALANSISGSWDADSILGGAGDDQLYGNNGNDTLIGGAGNDSLYGGGGNEVMGDGEGNNLLDGGAGNDTLTAGGSGSETLVGGAGNDSLVSISGSQHRLEGGTGDDRYQISNQRPTMVENANEGIDTVFAQGGTFTLPDNLENLWITKESGGSAVVGIGNAQNNVIETAGYSSALLQGMGGSDTLIGYMGGETLDGGAGHDTLLGHGGDPTTDKKLSGNGYNYGDGNNADTTYVVNGVVGLNSFVSWDDTIEEYEESLFYNANRYTGPYAYKNWGGNDTVVIDGTGVTGGGLVLDMSFQSSYLENRTFKNWSVGVEVRGTSNGERIENQSAVGMTLKGNGGGDTLVGGAGNDWLDGGSGVDYMAGGTGDDTYFVDDWRDTVVENSGEGTDEVVKSGNTTLSGQFANIENLTLVGSENFSGTGNAANNRITGNARNNVLDGGAGADTMIGGDGSDTYYVDDVGDVVTETGNGWDRVFSSVSFSVGAGDGIDRVDLTGSADINATGNAISQRLAGNDGNNVLGGGGGADTLAGGAGNDTYYLDSWDDVIEEALNAGTDSVYSSSNRTLSANVENLTLTGSALKGTGNELANVITGNAGNNVLNGNYGGDTIYGGAGNDTLSNGIDGNTWLDDNWLYGGTGDDTYWVDMFGHSHVVENAGEGNDTIMLEYATQYTLAPGNNVENLRMVENLAAPYGGVYSNARATGNELNNVIDTSGFKRFYDSGNDTLDGGGGADTLIGGYGADVYILDNLGDVVIEGVNGGSGDEIRANFSYTIAADVYVEKLTLTGTLAINATGSWRSETYLGNSADNVIDGKGGGDLMQGQGGNDTYFVDNALDNVVEGLGGGTDTVNSSITYTLGDNVDNLNLIGGEAINGTGNTLNNIIGGNWRINALSGLAGNDTLSGAGGNDTLDGGSGADSMSGGMGDDTFIVDNGGDVVVENWNEGTDTVLASTNFTLSVSVENLTLTGTASIDGTGNGMANVLIGNDGNNVLDGRAGADTMTGGSGNDTYVVDNAGDVVVEAAGGGTDIVNSSVSYTLGGEVENLTLTGTAAISGTGNGTANVLIGNAGNNLLDGGAGADLVSGGDGDDVLVFDSADTLDGGAGRDTLRVDGAGVGIDLTTAAGSTLKGLGRIDLTGSGDNTLTLDSSGLLALTGTSTDLVVKGNAGDTVVAYGKWGWWQGNDSVIGGETFHTYSAGGATLRVQDGVGLNIASGTMSVANLGSGGFRLWSDSLLNPGDGDYDAFGTAVSSGDVNGDGFDDIIVGAPYTNVNYTSTDYWAYDDPAKSAFNGSSTYNGTAYDAGAAYVIYGKAGGFAAVTEVHTLTSGDGFAVLGDGLKEGSTGTWSYHATYAPNGSGYWWGTEHSDVASVGSALSTGDINGDGIDDLIMGAPGSWPNAPTGGWSAEPHSYSNRIGWYHRQGANFTVFGNANGSDISRSVGGDALDGSNGFDMVPVDVGAGSGVSVGAIGDFNGDGFGDVIVGGYYKHQVAIPYGSRAGAAYIVFGAASGIPADVDLESLAPGDGSQGFELWDYNSTIKRLGYSVSSAGDVNGDGCDDLVVGTQWNQGVYVLLGSPGGPGTGKLDASTFDNMTDGFSFEGGGPVASAGDFNGDGFDDLLFGNQSPGGGGDSGVSVLFGSATNAGLQFVANAVETGTDTWVYNGNTYTNEWTWYMGTAALDSYYGGDGTYGFVANSSSAGATFGAAVASAGDINGDGYDDLIIGDAEATVGANAYAGVAYVIFGTAGGIGPNFDLTTLNGMNGFAIQGSAEYEYVGSSVSSAGDINGDGYDDIIVGAGSSYGGNGSAYVIFGRDFNGTAGTMGTAGSETLQGSGAGTVVKAGMGDDVIEISDGMFFRIDGGGGTDTLKLTGSGMSLNFGNLQAKAVEGIEAIDMTGAGANTLTLTALQAQRLTDGTRVLAIHGDSGDQLTVVGATADPGNNGAGFAAYVFGAMQLRVDSGIAVTTNSS